MKTLTMNKVGLIAALAAVGLVLASPGPARAQGKGSMEIGLASHYVWLAMDAADFEPNLDYGLIFHYWLNDTSSVFVGYTQMSFLAPITVDGSDDDFTFSTGMLFGGFRYRPEIDLWVQPYLETGIAYQSWSTRYLPASIETREGSSIGYFAGLGLEHDLTRSLTIGLNGRYYYMVMAEKIESDAVLNANGKYNVDKDPFVNVGFAAAGVELTWRLK